MLNELLEMSAQFERRQDIADRVEALPPHERTYEINIVYAHALTLLDRAEEALHLLDDLRGEGHDEANWNGRMGHALSWMRREPEALPYIDKAMVLAENGQYVPALGDGRDSWAYLLSETKGIAEKRTASNIHYQTRLQNRKQPQPGGQPFKDFDFTDFWHDGEYAKEHYLCAPPTDDVIADLEAELGYKLPASYIWLMRQRNGGSPSRSYYPIDEDAAACGGEFASIVHFLAISREKSYALGGISGNSLITGDWGYPKIGVPICPCNGSREMIFLDYTHCGPDGEPVVVLVEDHEKLITYLADDFESFVLGLCDDPEDEEVDGWLSD